jgi:hypothetical protein
MGAASLRRRHPGEIHPKKCKASIREGAAGSRPIRPVHIIRRQRSNLITDEEIIEMACALGEINQGAVQISRGSLGVSVPMRESVKLFEEISSRSGRPVIWQSITHRWDKPNEWRELLDLAGETINRGVQYYPLCNARLFNNRLTMKNAQVFDDLPPGRRFCSCRSKRASRRSKIPRRARRCATKRWRKPSRRASRGAGIWFI